MADPLDEFASEFPSEEPPAPDASRRRAVPELPSASVHPAVEIPIPAIAVPERPRAPEATAAAHGISIDEILRREVPIGWDEAVAVVEELCLRLMSGRADVRVPGQSDVLIADGTVLIRDGAGGEPDVCGLGRLLHSLLARATAPAPLRLFVAQATSHGSYSSIGDFAKALAYFGKPGREELIRALYSRCAASQPTPSQSAQPRPPETPREEPSPTKAPEPPKRSIPKWAVAAVAAIVLVGASAWIWSMRAGSPAAAIIPSLIAEAREVVANLGIGASPDSPTATADAVVAPPVRREPATQPRTLDASAASAPLPSRPTTTRRPTTTSRPTTPQQRRARPIAQSLVQPPSSGELSARLAEAIISEARHEAIYSDRDSDVEPPILMYPQLPANLMLAGEDRLNVMEIVVSETGAVERVRLIAGPTRMPDVMLLSGAKAWRFTPAFREGEAVRYRALVSWAGTP